MNQHEIKPKETRPLKILYFLYIAIILGVFTVGTAFFYGQRDSAQDDRIARQNQQFLKRIEKLEKEQKKTTNDHRLRSEEIHADLCRLVYEIIQATNNPKFDGVEPCDDPLLEDEIKNGTKEL